MVVEKEVDDNDVISIMKGINEIIDELIDIADDYDIKRNLKLINFSIYLAFCKNK